MPLVRLFACAIALLVAASGISAEECRPLSAGSGDAGARRAAAIVYISAINAAQARMQKEEGRYAPLNKLPEVPNIPVGFIPKLLLDQWSYVLSVKDYFDPCGRAFFSDERGVIYDAYPHITAVPTSAEPAEVSYGEGSTSDHR